MASVFDKLQPQLILNSIERAGFRPTGEIRQLNSYENRVFDLSLEHKKSSPGAIDRLVAKFYRPGRWTKAAILDEHQFLFDLQSEGIPAIAPLPMKSNSSVAQAEEFYFALFPRVVGRLPQEFLPGDLQKVGRTLARIHNVGALQRAENRIVLNAETHGYHALPTIEKYIYPELWNRYEETALRILEYLDDHLNPDESIRIHGDCHRGNLLHNGEEFFFIDFDDFCNGPVVQDFWMLLGGRFDDDESQRQQEEICLGYEELREIPDQWHLIEPLRGLRIIMYASWIGARWTDPSFRQLFPQYTTYNYWLEELEQLSSIANQL